MNNKKAQFQLSVKWVVIIIIGLVLLSMLIFFIRPTFRETRIKFEEQSQVTATPPEVVISNPEHGKTYKIYEELNFDASRSYDLYGKIKKYYWDFDGDGKIDSNDKTIKYSYEEPGEFNVILRIMNDRDAIGKSSITIFVIPDNINNQSKYLDNPAFMVQEDNKDNILKYLPLMFDSNLKKYPYIVYTQNPPTIEGYTSRVMPSLSLSDYLSYWNKTASFVLIDFSDDKTNLLGALYATFTNSPVLFHSEAFGDITKGKTVYVIGNIGQDVLSGVKGEKKFLSKSDLMNRQKNIYNKIYSNVNVSVS